MFSHIIDVMETPLTLKTPDGKEIFGTLNKGRIPTDKLLVFVHGLGAHANGHVFYNAARYFPTQGIDTCRFDLYPGGATGRFLRECTVETHVSDLNLVLGQLRPQYERVFLAGYSMGGMVVQLADEKLFDALILIASAAREVLDDTPIITPYGQEYVANFGVQYLLSKEMFASMKDLPSISEAAQKISKPLLVVCGGNDTFMSYSRQYHDMASSSIKRFKVIPGTGHNFNEGNTAQDLYAEIADFAKTVLH